MRIGIDCRMYSSKFTGIGRVNFELIKYLTQLDDTHTYVLFFNEPEYSDFELPKTNFEKVLVGARHYSFAEQTVFLKKLWQAKLDLMHFTHFNSPLLYFGKQIVTIHDMTLSFFPGKKMTSIIHRLAYHLIIWSVCYKAKRIIAVSENTKNDIVKLLHVSPQKVQVVYEGVADHFSTPPTEEQKEKVKEIYKLQRPFLLYVGVWRNHKNVIGLVKTLHKLVHEKNLDIDLVITGKRDPVYQEEVFATVKDLGLEDRFKAVGLVPEENLRTLYYLAELFVFASFYEGFGIPPLEALTTGLPVASSNTSCMPEVCGDAVIYFDPYDLNDMTEKVAMLYNNKELQKELVAKGRERLKMFSWEKMTQETLDIYNSTK